MFDEPFDNEDLTSSNEEYIILMGLKKITSTKLPRLSSSINSNESEELSLLSKKIYSQETLKLCQKLECMQYKDFDIYAMLFIDEIIDISVEICYNLKKYMENLSTSSSSYISEKDVLEETELLNETLTEQTDEEINIMHNVSAINDLEEEISKKSRDNNFDEKDDKFCENSFTIKIDKQEYTKNTIYQQLSDQHSEFIREIIYYDIVPDKQSIITESTQSHIIQKEETDSTKEFITNLKEKEERIILKENGTDSLKEKLDFHKNIISHENQKTNIQDNETFQTHIREIRESKCIRENRKQKEKEDTEDKILRSKGSGSLQDNNEKIIHDNQGSTKQIDKSSKKSDESMRIENNKDILKENNIDFKKIEEDPEDVVRKNLIKTKELLQELQSQFILHEKNKQSTKDELIEMRNEYFEKFEETKDSSRDIISNESRESETYETMDIIDRILARDTSCVCKSCEICKRSKIKGSSFEETDELESVDSIQTTIESIEEEEKFKLTNKEKYREKLRKMKIFHGWPRIEKFTIDLGVARIKQFMRLWRTKEAWKYSVQFIASWSDKVSDFHLYQGMWSIPTKEYPVSQATASIYFTVEVSRVKPKFCLVDVTLQFEGSSTVHRANQFQFMEQWLFNIIDAKLLLFKSLRF